MWDGVKRPAETEMVSRHNNRKSLVITAAIKQGEKITPANIDTKRPGHGIACAEYDNVLGRTASRDLSAEDVLNWDDLN